MKPDPAGREPDAGVRRLSCTGKRPQRAQIAEQKKERKPCCANGPENRQPREHTFCSEHRVGLRAGSHFNGQNLMLRRCNIQGSLRRAHGTVQAPDAQAAGKCSRNQQLQRAERPKRTK